MIVLLKQKLTDVFGDNIHDVVLFGSQSRNKQNHFSDYDILIVIKHGYTWKEKNTIRDICYDISVDNDILIDSKIISLPDIENKIWGKHPLITDAIKYGIHA